MNNKYNTAPQEVIDEFNEMLNNLQDIPAGTNPQEPQTQMNTQNSSQDSLSVAALQPLQNENYNAINAIKRNSEQGQETDDFIALAKLKAGNINHKYSRCSAAELMATPAPIEYLIDGYIQKGAMHMLFGESGCKKTFATLDLAFSISCPLINSWCGKDIEHGLVIYLAGEGTRGLAKREAAWLISHDVSPQDLNFEVIDEPFQLNTKDPNFSINNTIANIWGICAEVGQKPVLIIVDTLNRYLEGHENDTEAMSQYVASLTKLSREFDCATLTIHHSGLAPENKNRPRGSSALFGACDIVIKAEANGESLRLDQTKNKDAEEIKGLVLDFDEITLPSTWDRKNGTPETSLVPKLSPYSTHDKPESRERKKPEVKLTATQRRARNTYKAACEKSGIFIHNDEQTGHSLVGVYIEDWRKVSYSMSSSDNDSTKRGNFNKERKQLLELDMLLIKREIEGREYYCLDLEAEGASEADYRRLIAGAVGTREYLAKKADAGGLTRTEGEQEAGAKTDSEEHEKGGNDSVTPKNE